jgi:hypothetical protein
MDSVRRIADSASGLQTRLAPNDAYGRPGELTLDGSRLRVVALAHPGFIRQTTNATWRHTLTNWKTSTRG